ncbi:hypothetical protein Tcan_09016, partial [Toxocara canis]
EMVTAGRLRTDPQARMRRRSTRRRISNTQRATDFNLFVNKRFQCISTVTFSLMPNLFIIIEQLNWCYLGAILKPANI